MELPEKQKNLAGLLDTRELFLEKGWEAPEVAQSQAVAEVGATRTYSILGKNSRQLKLT